MRCQNAWASFSFNGSTIRLYAKLGTNHGVYSGQSSALQFLQADGQSSWTVSRPHGTPVVRIMTSFSSAYMSPKVCLRIWSTPSSATSYADSRVLTRVQILSNDGGSNCYTTTQNGTSCWVDLDYITWTAPVPS